MKLPLDGLVVLEFCQYMAGPSAGLKLTDLGARVIKIERPKVGEGGRRIAISNLFVDESSLVFHTVNRNKESFSADLKSPKDLAAVKKLIGQVDIITHNFRPGVMEKLGLDYETIKELNDRIIYASVSGYGNLGPWSNKPGQDLLAQSISGLTWLTGDERDAPTPMGLAVADLYCGTHLTQGILAALIRRNKTDKGALVEVSLLESMLDFQFEVITTYLYHPTPPVRAEKGSAHAYLSAPYGVYKTKDRYMAIAMTPLERLAKIIQSDALRLIAARSDDFNMRNRIMAALQTSLIEKTTKEWLNILEPNGIWSSDVLNYKDLLENESFKVLNFDQEVQLSDGQVLRTTRCPIRINNKNL